MKQKCIIASEICWSLVTWSSWKAGHVGETKAQSTISTGGSGAALVICCSFFAPFFSSVSPHDFGQSELSLIAPNHLSPNCQGAQLNLTYLYLSMLTS